MLLALGDEYHFILLKLIFVADADAVISSQP